MHLRVAQSEYHVLTALNSVKLDVFDLCYLADMALMLGRHVVMKLLYLTVDVLTLLFIGLLEVLLYFISPVLKLLVEHSHVVVHLLLNYGVDLGFHRAASVAFVLLILSLRRNHSLT